MDNIKLTCSGSHKWIKCTASPSMESAAYSANNNYKVASEGVIVHKLAENKIKYMQGEKTSQINHMISLEMEKMANMFVSCLLQSANDDVHNIYMEEEIDLNDIRIGMKGSADAIVVTVDDDRKYIYANVFDLKTGFTKISAKNNTQLYLYALGLYDRLKSLITKGYTIETMVHIIQPSMNYTSSIALSSQEIEDFRKLIRQKIEEIDNNPQFNAGEHCAKHYCKARTTCRAYAEYVNRDINKIVELKKSEKELTPEEIVDIIERAPEFSKWMEGVISTAKDKMMNTDYKLPGYKLKVTNKRGLIKDKAKVIMHLNSLGVDESCYMEYTLMSLSKIEKILGKKCKDLEPIVEESIFRTTLQKIDPK